MSTHHHSVVSRGAQDLIKQVLETHEGNWSQIFGIEKREDDTILDIVENRVYESLADWAIWSVEQEDAFDQYAVECKRGRYDDEDYK